MEEYQLGRMTIQVQDEVQPNADYYHLQIPIAEPVRSLSELEDWIDLHVEDPERFELEQEGDLIHIYSRQPDAIVELASFLNQQLGVTVDENEMKQLRETLIQMQT